MAEDRPMQVIAKDVKAVTNSKNFILINANIQTATESTAKATDMAIPLNLKVFSGSFWS